MNLIQLLFGYQFYGALRRKLCCSIGFHGSKSGADGTPANVCCWGCGLIFNKQMWKDYIVTLRDGQEYRVKAVNEFHAGTAVMYGYKDGQRLVIDGHTGKSKGGSVKVHRENIATVRLVLPSNNESNLGD